MTLAEPGRLLYFAYGSNMSGPRLAARIASMRKIGVATLAGHRLAFHKVSHDGSAKCDVSVSSDSDDHVLGVVFDIAAADQATLDRYEGRGQGYEIKPVELALPDGQVLSAITYYATRTDAALKPFHWYKHHVLQGALEHGLPEYYVEAIRGVSSVADPDDVRTLREMAIYR